MKMKEFTSPPFMASINGSPPQSVKQRFETYKIRNDKEMLEFAEAMHKGRDIICQIEGQGCTYIMVRELVPSKIAVAGGPVNNLPPGNGGQP